MDGTDISLEADVAKAVTEVRTRWHKTLPVVVDHTQWTVRNGAIEVQGGVLTARQSEDFLDALQSLTPEARVPRPTILSDPDSPWQTHHWVAIEGNDAIDLLQAPRGGLQNQWSPPAWLRHFAEHDAHSLIQLPDGTIGWVATTRLNDKVPSPTVDPWRDIRRARPDKALPTQTGDGTDSQTPLERAARLARSRLGRPYLWGGNRAEAADCSGFVQSIVAEAAGLLMPKHTSDQLRLGLPVRKDAIAAGDLVFVRGRQLGLQHVGLVLKPEAAPLQVVHASMSQDQVLEETLAVFLDRHDYVDTRRVVDWQGLGEGEPQGPPAAEGTLR